MVKELMTRDEFISYAYEVLYGEGSECLFDSIAEYNNEVAMFGDAGPGHGYRLRQQIAEYNSIGARYSSLTGQPFQRLALRLPR